MKYSKQSLDKLLLLIEEICSEEKNAWFQEKLIENLIQIETPSSRKSINHIYELCVKEIIKKHSKDFYKGFPIKKLESQLLLDFTRMEHFRREDKFEDFGLAMFQQIEGIVNFCFDQNFLKEKIKNDRDAAAFIEWSVNSNDFKRSSKDRLIPMLLIKTNSKFKEDNSLPFYTIDQSTEDKYFDNNGLPITKYTYGKSSWGFLNKFRAVLYYVYFKDNFKSL